MKALALLALLMVQAGVKPAMQKETVNKKPEANLTQTTVRIMDHISLDGHYQLIVDDPSNTLRCEMPSSSQGQDSKLTAFTIVCFVPHVVPVDKKTAEEKK